MDQRNGGSRAHKENQLKNRNIEAYYRRLTERECSTETN